MDQTKIAPLNAPLAPAPLNAPLAPAPRTSHKSLASLTSPASHTPTSHTPLGTIDTPIASHKSTALVPIVGQSLAARVLENGCSGSHYYGDGRSSNCLPRDGRSQAMGISAETDLNKKIIVTHDHESDERGLPVKLVIHTIEIIFHRANVELPGFNQASLGYFETTEHENALYSAASLQDIIELPPWITDAISYEILSKCSTGVDVHTITMDILHLIKHYNWDSKAVLALSSFAVTFGEFCLVVSLYSTNQLAKSVAILKQLPEYLEHTAALRPKLDALFDVIKEIIDVTKKIVEFYDLPRHEYFTTESPELLAAVNHIPTAVYWTIRSIVVSATQILALTGMGIEYLTEPWELSSLAHKLNNIKGHLVEIIDRCILFIARKKDEEEFVYFDQTMGGRHIDNQRPLKALFNPKDGQPALYDSDSMIWKIIATHVSDERGLPVKSAIDTIEVIFHRANVELPGFNQASLGYSETTEHEKELYSSASLQDLIEFPPRITSAISCEILGKCSTGVDVHTITMDILHLIKHYNWDSKAVLALSSFAVTFGEFRLVVSLYSTNQLAKSVAILKQLPEYLEHTAALRPKLDALFDVIKEIIDVTKKIVEFYDLPRHEYFTTESPELLAAVNHIPTAVYWTIRSIVVSATQILALTGMGIEYLTEPWELSSLAHKLNNIKGHLVEIIDRCILFIARKKGEVEVVEFHALPRGRRPIVSQNKKNKFDPVLKPIFNPKVNPKIRKM